MIWIIITIILFFFSWRYYWLILRCGIGVNFSREVCTSGITTRFRSCGNDVTLRRFFVLHDMIPFQRFTFRAGSLIATGRFIGTQNISIDDNKKNISRPYETIFNLNRFNRRTCWRIGLFGLRVNRPESFWSVSQNENKRPRIENLTVILFIRNSKAD